MIEEIKKVVETLNYELYDKLENLNDYEEGLIEFIFKSNGNIIIVEFLGFDLWNSENDERDEFCSQCNCRNFEDPNTCCREYSDYEPLEGFLRREANRMIRLIENLHF